MPRFYFDVYDDGRCSRDERGMDLPHVTRVWEIAVTMVDELARAKRYLHPPQSIYIVVRDSSDAVVYETRRLMRVECEPASEQAPHST